MRHHKKPDRYGEWIQKVRVMPANIEECEMAMALLDLQYGRGDHLGGIIGPSDQTNFMMRRWENISNAADIFKHVLDFPKVPGCARRQCLSHKIREIPGEPL
eukprot:GHVR01010709.1.p1 GENE.GHVR01010709.1~~GHVR01010709.1.p1  ORF type:complete len:102 (+),score=4.22 GHVR01010709.1:719-1024(+)